jgi:formylglycine-generating enzyme required for sulfatase activity
VIEALVGNEKRCLKPKDTFRDCPNCPEMVVVPAGNFTMGSPADEPQRSSEEALVSVTIAAPFAAGKYAVTFDEWDACIADCGSLQDANSDTRTHIGEALHYLNCDGATRRKAPMSRPQAHSLGVRLSAYVSR